MTTVHIIGAGIAGLSCAIRLARYGYKIAIHESALHAGGRCRSFYDRALGCWIDNGNHLLLSANRAVRAYCAEIGTEAKLITFDRPVFPFVDLTSGERWTVRPNRGFFPWWIFQSSSRIPRTQPLDYLSWLRLVLVEGNSTVNSCLSANHPLWYRFWQPLTLAMLNCPPEIASVQLLRAAFLETFARGGKLSSPMISKDYLSHTFIQPAIKYLCAIGSSIQFSHRVRSISFDRNRATSLDFSSGTPVYLAASDWVVLAVPPTAASALVPSLTVPEDGQPIINAHFQLPYSLDLNGLQKWQILGLINGTAHWIFVRGAIISVTVSAAVTLINQRAEILASCLWADVAAALGLSGLQPPSRIIKERRATFAQTPSNLHRRPGSRTTWNNLVLAGDWTDTGLPATLESAVRSGHAAAAAIMD
jgi:squalene-associated FAD-dependent desaturase